VGGEKEKKNAFFAGEGKKTLQGKPVLRRSERRGESHGQDKYKGRRKREKRQPLAAQKKKKRDKRGRGTS